MLTEEFPVLSPINFYQMRIECSKLPTGAFPQLDAKAKKYLLPDMTTLSGEESFANVSMGWTPQGIEFYVQFSVPFEDARYPDVTRGDSIEIFLDTRDVKSSGFNTRFCHHFYFLPKAVEGHQAAEITRFRTEDTHELCDPSLLKVKSKFQKSSYTMHIFIPSESMVGYDADQFDRIGFSYRINRSGGEPQHFSVLSEEFKIDQQPSLWSSIRFVE